MAKKMKITVTDDDGNEEEIEVPEHVHRTIAGVARAEAEKVIEERVPKPKKEKGFWDWGDDDEEEEEEKED